MGTDTMTRLDLDDVDCGILHLLQLDARNHSAAEIADEVGVAPNTVRNRIERLEDAGVIRGYHPEIDYECAGFQLHVIFICTSSITQRDERAEQALQLEGVVSVSEILSGDQNLAVEAVADTTDEVSQIGRGLEEIGLKIHDEWFLKSMRVKPFDDFGREVVEE